MRLEARATPSNGEIIASVLAVDEQTVAFGGHDREAASARAILRVWMTVEDVDKMWTSRWAVRCAKAVLRVLDIMMNLRKVVFVLHVMTTSLSHGGAGLGTVGLPESKLKELATEAKFGSVRRVPLENPFNNLYEVAS